MQWNLLLLFVLILSGCSSSNEEGNDSPAAKEATPPPAPKKEPKKLAVEPDAVKVQHILIGFQDAVGYKRRGQSGPERTQEEAKKLAEELLAQVQDGGDFNALTQQHSDDPGPGIYGMVNQGKPKKEGFYPRTMMAKSFGDVAFSLPIGEIGMCGYDAGKSPYGWHIIKRLE